MCLPGVLCWFSPRGRYLHMGCLLGPGGPGCCLFFSRSGCLHAAGVAEDVNYLYGFELMWESLNQYGHA